MIILITTIISLISFFWTLYFYKKYNTVPKLPIIIMIVCYAVITFS